MRAIFFDRDGVINDNRKPVNTPEDLILFPGVPEALKKAKEAGYEIFIVTNQGGIELGHLSHEMLKKIHGRLKEQLMGYCDIRGIEYCPDFKSPSPYRKPAPGMLLKLAEEHQIDLSQSWMVGDRDTDISAGLRAGCKTAKIGAYDKRAHINESRLKKGSRNRSVDLEAVIDAILRAES